MLAALSLLIAAASDEPKFVERLGYKIAYRTVGEPVHGTTVAIAGGPGFSSRAVWAFGFELAGVTWTVLFDQLGTGDSSPATGAPMLSLGFTVADLEAVRKDLGLERWHVFGQSWGAIVATAYAAQHPDRVESLTLTGVPSFDLLGQQVLSQNLTARLPQSVQNELFAVQADPALSPEDKTARMVLGVMPYYFFDEAWGKSLAGRAPEGMFSPKVFGRLYVDVTKPETYDRIEKGLAAWKGRALIVQGHQDPVGAAMGHLLKERCLPGARVVMLDRCGHFAWLERPDDFFGAVAEHLAGKRVAGWWDLMEDDPAYEDHVKARTAAGWPFGK
jgi:proline iminopeptidase